MAHHVATLAIACSQLDAGQIIDRHDRPIADFRDTELSTKISDIFVHFFAHVSVYNGYDERVLYYGY